ncbi:hypothetical protein SLS53_001944 [Cytospora paraplurivora]|uniref:Uncharacterized protein n=1 Tax=Cytospora paraplurivora TaxID=2898453 RepID=A0AAN9UF44_9PEZI
MTPSKSDVASPNVALGGGSDTRGSPQKGLRASGARSTDPDFFRKVYDEHQNVGTDLIQDSVRDSNGNMGSSDRQKGLARSAKDNSSSLTDPTLRGTRKKGGNVDRLGFDESTQVTTPRDDAPAGLRRDIYDFPSSEEEEDTAGTTHSSGKKGATVLYGKRKREQTVTPAETAVSSSPAQSPSQADGLVLTHINDNNASPRLRRKKRKSGTTQNLSQIAEDVDLLVIPRTADMNESPANRRVSNQDPGSIILDTFREEQGTIEHPPASFFIAPLSRLTASQKQEFVPVSGSSENEKEETHGTLLLESQAETQEQKFRSSEATIAYPTPSRYRSSAHNLPDPQETGDCGPSSTTSSSRKRADIARMGGTMTLTRTKRRRDNDDNDDDELAQDAAFDYDDIGMSREEYLTRPNGTTSTELDKHTTEPSVGEEDLGSARNKRARTKQHVDVDPEDSWDSDNIGAHKEHYKPRSSRRRSRAVVQEDAEDAPKQSMPATCPPGQASPREVEGAEPILLSSGQQAPEEETTTIEGIDPAYLAALPSDLRQEVISSHLAQTARTRGRGRLSQSLSALQTSPEEVPQPKKRGRKKKSSLNEQAVTAAQQAETQAAPAPVAPAKRKRGRPRKSEAMQLAPAPAADEDISLAYEAGDIAQAADDCTTEDAAVEPLQEAPMPAKAPSRRGRKRKAVAEPLMTAEEEPTEYVEEAVESVDSVQALSDTIRAPSKRGRKKKVVEEPPTAPADEPQQDGDNAQDQRVEEDRSAQLRDEPVETFEEAVPLQDISNTTSFSGPSTSTKRKDEDMPERGTDWQKEMTPETKAKEIPGPKSTSSTASQGQGKVPLRVGLSKRLRIAPLLKVIRK